jgi:hypothetical protein
VLHNPNDVEHTSHEGRRRDNKVFCEVKGAAVGIFIHDKRVIFSLMARATPSRPAVGFPMLATVDVAGVAHVRTVVVRGFDVGRGQLWFSTDARSQKAADLVRQPMAELCFWLARRKVQIRVLARWRVVAAKEAARSKVAAKFRRECWREHSAASQKIFFMGTPGLALDEKSEIKILRKLPASPPAEFAVVVGTIEGMDVLRLSRPAHERWVHIRNGKVWSATEISP